MRPGGIPTLLFPSRFLASSSSPSSVITPSPRVLRLSRSITRGVFRTLPRLLLRARGAPAPLPQAAGFPASCATVNHSACDCVRLITVIRLLLVPVYRPLITIIDFPLVRHFLVFMPRGCTGKRIPVAPRHATDHGKACHSVAYTP